MYDFLSSWALVLTLSVTHEPRRKSNKAISISLNWKPLFQFVTCAKWTNYVYYYTRAWKRMRKTCGLKLFKVAQKNSPGEDRNNEMIGNAYIFEESYLDSRRIRVAAARGLENLK